jgi:hypothetical protein
MNHLDWHCDGRITIYKIQFSFLQRDRTDALLYIIKWRVAADDDMSAARKVIDY